MPTTPYNRAGPGQPIPDYNEWTLQHRGAMAPWGVYENPQGETASGFAWPAMITEPIEAGKRFFAPGGGFENNPNHESEKDALTLLMSLYGGNALSGTFKGAALANALAESGRMGASIEQRAAVNAQNLQRALTPDENGFYDLWHASPNIFDNFDTAARKSNGAVTYFAEKERSGPGGSITAGFGPNTYNAKIDPAGATILDGRLPFEQLPDDVKSILASNPDIVSQWRHQPNAMTFNGVPYDASNPAHYAAQLLHQVGNRGRLISNLEAIPKTGRNDINQKALEVIRSGTEPKPDMFQPGVPLSDQYNMHNFYRFGLDKLGFDMAINPDEVGLLNHDLIKHLYRNGEQLYSDTGKPNALGSALATQMSIEDQIASITNKTRPYRAAMRFGNEIFQGVNHGVALANAEAKLGDKVWENWNSKTGYPDGTEGFVTRDGTFLTRNEAARATPGYYNPDGEMHASSLKDYNLLSDQKPSLLGSALASQMGDGSGIIAYHGSPHSFDKFDMSKIGTGEGAQAYGPGLYFAENEGVAKAYRDTLAPDHAKYAAGNYKAVYGDGALDAAMRDGDTVAAEYLKAEKEGTAKAPGHMYQVRINANPEDFLDWDKPLSQQSEKVQRILNETGLQPTEADLGSFAGVPITSAPRWADTAQHSNALREAGIPGIRYLDQMSRSAADGTSNYVVFDDSLIDILKKYGLAGMSLYGASNALSDKTTY